MCNQINLLQTDCKQEGVFSIIKAQSFERARSFFKGQFKGKDDSGIIQQLNMTEKFLSSYGEQNPDKPAPIKVTVCRGKVCMSVEFLKKYDIDITIQL
jgi:hypothetical protein